MAGESQVPLSAPNPDFEGLYDRLAAGRSVLEHLDELRRRILYSCIAIAVGMVVSFTFINRIFDFVFAPIRGVLPPGGRLVYTQPGEAFSVFLQIAFIAGIVFASPVIMYHVWRLIAPALYLGAKRFAISFISLTTICFIAGALFNHYVVFKFMMAFFGSFSSSELAFWPRLDDVFGLYTKMLFIMGLVFQMPTIVFFLSKMDLVTARFLRKNFKYAVFIIFIVAAVITPSGDPYNQTILAVPMIGLYILCIFIAWMFAPAAAKTKGEEG